MEITRDEPGRVLEICAPSGSGRWREGLVVLVLFPFLIVPLLMVFPTLSGASSPKGPWCMGPWLVVWYGIFLPMTIGAVWSSRRLVRLSVDRASGEFVAEETASVPFFARRVSVPLQDLEGLVVEEQSFVFSEGGCSIEWRFRVRRAGREEVTLVAPWAVRGVDRREEFMDFAVRLGAAAGLLAYEADLQPPEGARHTGACRVLLHRERAEGRSPIEAPTAVADYEADTRAGEPLPPDLPVFDPATLPGPYRVERWQPGKAIALYRPADLARTRRNILGCGIVCGILLTVLVPAAIAAAGKPIVWVIAIAPPVGLFLVNAVFSARYWGGSAVVIDWRKREIRLGLGLRGLVLPFDNVEQLEAHWGRYSLATHMVHRLYFHVRLRRAVRGERLRETLLPFDDILTGPDEARRAGLAFARDLALAMGVHLRFSTSG